MTMGHQEQPSLREHLDDTQRYLSAIAESQISGTYVAGSDHWRPSPQSTGISSDLLRAGAAGRQARTSSLRFTRISFGGW